MRPMANIRDGPLLLKQTQRKKIEQKGGVAEVVTTGLQSLKYLFVTRHSLRT